MNTPTSAADLAEFNAIIPAAPARSATMKEKGPTL
jgi:hypothetical protein